MKKKQEWSVLVHLDIKYENVCLSGEIYLLFVCVYALRTEDNSVVCRSNQNPIHRHNMSSLHRTQLLVSTITAWSHCKRNVHHKSALRQISLAVLRPLFVPEVCISVQSCAGPEKTSACTQQMFIFPAVHRRHFMRLALIEGI